MGREPRPQSPPAQLSREQHKAQQEAARTPEQRAAYEELQRKQAILQAGVAPPASGTFGKPK